MLRDITITWAPTGVFLIAALFAPLLSGKRGRVPAGAWAIVPVWAFVYFLAAGRSVWKGEVIRQQLPWATELGFSLDGWISPTGLLLALLVSGMGALVVLYSAAYLSGDARLGRFLGILFLFAGAMLGLATAENLLILFIFWECTSISSYLLIGFNHEREEARKAALDALLITAAGGLVLLAGIVLLGEAGGSYRMGELVENRGVVVAHPFYPAILLCVLLGAFTKSAQVPFHFWLPGAMAAPAPVSAYLHSATMVKAGVFLIALLRPVLGGTELWHYSLIGIGTVTMTWGALVAMVQTDFKRLLAYSTISALGTLILLLGIENTLAVKAAIIFFLVHALYKGALFMVAGAIEKISGTRDVSCLGGLIKAHPLLGIGAVAAAFSMSGLPPFVGFIAKELLYEVKLETPPIGHLLLVCGFIANAANVVVALKVGLLPFLGKAPEIPPDRKRLPAGLWIGPLTLAAGSLLFGLAPGVLLTDPVQAMVSQIATVDAAIKLKLWHGFNLVLLLSACTVATGVGLFLIRERLWAAADNLRHRFGWNAATSFRLGLAGFITAAGRCTQAIQNGRLTTYLTIIFSSAILLLSAAWWKSGYVIGPHTSTAFRLDVFMVTLMLCGLAILMTRATRRMSLILLLGSVGFGIAALYALYGAPDLAITQILVETLTLVLFSLALYGLPGMQGEAEGRVARRTWGLALVVGLGFALLTLKAFDVQLADAVSREHAGRSLSEAHGKNVVNVILVDFRALDTLGEITVLMIAALGVFAMLGRESHPDPMPAREHPPVLNASARYTTPIMLVFSIYLLLRGHNEPGGGFIGGLVGAMAATLSHLAGVNQRLTLFRCHPPGLMLGGCLLATASGLPALFQQEPFLTGWWGVGVYVPAVGKVKLGTPLLFDIGVYLVVAGTAMMLYRVLQDQRMNSLASHPGKESA